MAKYNSFEEYLQLHYYDVLKEGLTEFVNENGFVVDEAGTTRYADFTVEQIDIIRVSYTKSEIDKVCFKLVFVATLKIYDEMIECGAKNYTAEFTCTMRGSFREGFEMYDEVESADDEIEENYTSSLVPVISRKDYDRYATKFLKHYCPEALETPMKLDIQKVAKNSEMRFFDAPLGDEVLGAIYFANDRADILTENGDVRSIDVKPGTVLINVSRNGERGQGATRNTFIHEAVHWYFHRNYFELRLLLDNKQTCAVCYRSSLTDATEEIEWMERQARALTPRILMPKKTALIKTKELIREIDADAEKKTMSVCDKYEALVKRFAKFFDVSVLSAKYRLMELGYIKVAGVLNYVDNQYIKPFTFAKKSLKDHQTFILDYASFTRLMEVNTRIREAVTCGRLIYTNAMLIANSPKYIDINTYKPTSYALGHADECCVIFNTYHDFCSHFSIPENTFLLSSSHNKTVHADADTEHLDYILEKSNENYAHFASHKKNLPKDFGETLKYHMKKCGYNQEQLAFDSDVNIKYISQAINETRIPTQNEIIKMSLAMRLSYPYLLDLLKKAEIPMIACRQEDAILLSCLVPFGRIGLDEFYERLCYAGQGHLLPLSRSFLENHNIAH